MSIRIAALSAVALALVCGIQSETSAANRRGMRAAPTAAPATTTTSILPSSAELAAVPAPQQGRALAYPVDVIRYGLTIHPGARIARGILGR